MNMMEILNQAGGINAIARELGVDETTASTGAAALLPAVLGGFKGQAQQQPEGLSGLIGMLGGLGGSGLLASVLGAGATNVDAGNNVLGQIFGTKDVSRTVAADAAAKTGISGDLLKKMLPMIAMAVAGYFATQASNGQPQPTTASDQTPQSGLGGMLGSVLGGLMGSGAQAAVPAPGMMGGIGALLDIDGDGNPLDDIIGMAGKFAR